MPLSTVLNNGPMHRPAGASCLLESGDEVGDDILQLGFRLVGQLASIADLLQQFRLRAADMREELSLERRDPRRVHFVEEAAHAGKDDRDLLLNSHRRCDTHTHNDHCTASQNP